MLPCIQRHVLTGGSLQGDRGNAGSEGLAGTSGSAGNEGSVGMTGGPGQRGETVSFTNNKLLHLSITYQ